MCGRFSEKEWVFLDFPYRTMYTATNLSNSYSNYMPVILLAFFKTTRTLFFGGGGNASFFENWEILNNELNVLKLEFEVNIMDNKTSHNSSSI